MQTVVGELVGADDLSIGETVGAKVMGWVLGDTFGRVDSTSVGGEVGGLVRGLVGGDFGGVVGEFVGGDVGFPHFPSTTFHAPPSLLPLSVDPDSVSAPASSSIFRCLV